MEKYVASIELAKKLKAAGYPQETQRYWHSLISHDMKRWSDYKLQDYKPDSDFGMRVFAAPLSDELLEQLPQYSPNGLYRLTIQPVATYGTWAVSYDDTNRNEDQGSLFSSEKPADALAKLWLWCKEHGYLEGGK